MSIHLQAHAFAGNPLKTLHVKPDGGNGGGGAAVDALRSLLVAGEEREAPSLGLNLKVLPFRKGRPLARSVDSAPDTPPKWHLGWVSPSEFKGFSADSFVYLGSGSGSGSGEEEEEGAVYWAIDVSESRGVELGGGRDGLCFVELRTLMVATDWADVGAMGELAIAGHAKALLEWHRISRFCGNCGSRTVPIGAGRRKQCTDETCKKRVYPRVDPVVIMLVIDKENDRALLSRQSRFVPRMWSCLAGFIEAGESLEEAVRRETWEETGIEVGEVIYHSSQPWPDAQWHSREDVKKALTFAEYEKAQRTAGFKVNQMCKGVEKGQNFPSSDFNVESGELAQMFIPGPFAIAHHLISTWVHEDDPGNREILPKKLNSVSNL